MKKILLLLLTMLFGLMLSNIVTAQCTPADSISCPDPENNGEVCPDSLNIGYVDKAYNQAVSILAPPIVVLYGDTTIVHHVHLVDVENLPPALTWQSNAANDDFYPGTYSCVLFSGICTDTGNYVLKIVVDVFVVLNGSPIFIGQNIDSTSLSIRVEKFNGIDESVFVRHPLKIWPNPFDQSFQLQFLSSSGNSTQVEIYSLQGKRVFSKTFYTVPGNNMLNIDGSHFGQKHFIVKLKTGNKQYSGILTKAP